MAEALRGALRQRAKEAITLTDEVLLSTHESLTEVVENLESLRLNSADALLARQETEASALLAQVRFEIGMRGLALAENEPVLATAES